MASKMQMAYKVYSALAKTPPVDFALSRVRARYHRKPAILHAQQMKELIEPLAPVSANELGLKVIPVASLGDEFTLDFVGKLSQALAEIPEGLVQALSSPIDGGEADAHFALAPDGLGLICAESERLFAVSADEPVLLKGANRSVLVFCQEFDGSKAVSDRSIKALAYAYQNKVDYVAAYLCGGADFGFQTKALAALAKKLVNLGCNAVLGAGSDQVIADGASVKRWDGTMAYGFTCLPEVSNGAAVALRVGVSFAPMPIVRAGFVPLHVSEAVVSRIDASSGNATVDEMASYAQIAAGCGRYREWRDVVVLQDLFDVLDMEIPADCAHLAKMGVGLVSTRQYNIQPGDVFCFLESYAEANDNPSPVEIRKLRVDESLSHGATFVLSFVKLSSCLPYALVESGRESHVAICDWLRSRLDVVAVGITGSIGKTSTKDMLSCVFRQGFNTFSSTRNENVQIKIGKNIQSIHRDVRAYVQECSGSRPGDAERHAKMIAPDAMVVTNVGLAHVGNFTGQEDLLQNKLAVYKALGPQGILLLNGDDPLLAKADTGCTQVLYAIDNHDADYYADSIVLDADGSSFEIVHGDHRVKARLNVLGSHNILNAVGCYALGTHFGLSEEQILAGLLEYQPSGVRQNHVRIEGYDLMVDCFNSSIGSVDSSLAVLDGVQVEGKKIAVLGDITGTGSMAVHVHEEMGRVVSEHHPDKVFFFGKLTKTAHEYATSRGVDAQHTEARDQLVALLKEQCAPGDFILFKGSSKMHLADVVDELFATDFSDQVSLDHGDAKKKNQDGVAYNVFRTHASAVAPSDRLADCITLAETVGGKPVRNISDKAFANMPNLTKVVLPASVVHIGSASFANCPKLVDKSFAEGVRYCAQDAFGI